MLLFEITKVRVEEARACAEEGVEGRERGNREGERGERERERRGRERRGRERRAGRERCFLVGEQEVERQVEELERQVEDAAEGLIRALQVKRDIVKCNKPA